MRRILLQATSLLVCSAGLAPAVWASAPAGERPVYRIPRTLTAITVDGKLDEPAWLEALRIQVDIEVQPGENIPAPVSAECLLTYDQRALYVGCHCFDPDPAQIRAHLTDRDEAWRNDYIGVMLDTFNDQRRAFEFLVNPLGVQGDLLRNEVASDPHEDSSWDAIWDSAGRITPTGYQVEMAIPFRAIRFPNGSRSHTWGIALFRAYPRTVRHQIFSVPLDRSNNCLLCQLGQLEGLEGIAPGHDLELAPTLTSQRADALRNEDDPAAGLERGDPATEAGLTGRWGITPNASLSATFNPDFSQVEADAAQLEVNTRFALFYSEKRPFFMEGSDFFATPIDAVYTRSVADPQWGVKLTGKGATQAYSAFVARDRLLNLLLPSGDGSSYGSYQLPNLVGAARYRHDVGRASTVGVLATTRQASQYHNRVVGVDGLWRFSPTDTVSFQLLRSSTRYPREVADEEEQPRGEFAGTALEVEYLHSRRDWQGWAWYRSLAPSFRADAGFVSRVDVRGGEVGGQRVWWGRPGQFFTRASLGAECSHFENFRGQISDQQAEVFLRLEGPYQSWVNLRAASFAELVEGTTYRGERFNVFFNVRPSGDFTASLGARWGDAIDYRHSRPAQSLRLLPGFTLNLGRQLYLQGNHTWERLTVAEGTLYTANLAQARVVYQFTAAFARLIVQYLHLDRDPSLHTSAVSKRSQHLSTQLLFSYKLNPQTVAFLGYGDRWEEGDYLDLTRTNRTLFLKLGYAWLL